ncbi:MAG: choice-of-anchor L domain-containing protein [Enhygromyxa sp.]
MTPIRSFVLTSSALSLLVIGCQSGAGGIDSGLDEGIGGSFGTSGGEQQDEGEGEGDAEAAGDGDGDSGDGDGDPGGDGDPDPTSGTKFDLAQVPDGNANSGGCILPQHQPCDANSNDPWHAIGVNCPGEYQVNAAFTGDPQALYVLNGQLGTYNPPTYPVLEGSKMVILSSGVAQQLTQAGAYASTALPGNDPGNLPAPLTPNPVSANETCNDNPALVGTGDCSNTIQVQWNQGNGAYDYAEMRMTGTVPIGASGFSYNFAFFSTEYPVYYKSSFNDMYIAWLESEIWTGNVSFDEMGNPISLNAGFLDYKDAPNPHDCPAPCSAPELQGTAMQGHAGTKWLSTSAGVVPGEDFTIVFAIFDLSDNILDSVVIIDNFEWNCDGGPPVTIPG